MPAIDLLAAKLRTPLQIEQHLSLAFEEAFRVGEKPVTVEVIEAVPRARSTTGAQADAARL